MILNIATQSSITAELQRSTSHLYYVKCQLFHSYVKCHYVKLIEQHAFKNVNNCVNTNIYSYLETSGGQSFNLYLNVVHFINTNVY